jgi:hypothetical protein
MPGVEYDQLYRLMQLADCVSVNLEGLTQERLRALAPKKDFQNMGTAMDGTERLSLGRIQTLHPVDHYWYNPLIQEKWVYERSHSFRPRLWKCCM